jgi:hypothetical protein
MIETVQDREALQTDQDQVEQTGEIEITESAYLELIGQLQRREISFSFSSIKNFIPPTGNPWKFVQNKLHKPDPTSAMQLGTVIDILLFTPDEMGGLLILPDGCALNSTEGVNNYGAWLDENSFIDLDEFHDQKFKGKVAMIKSILANLRGGKKNLVTQSDFRLAEFIVSRIQNDNLVMDFLGKSALDQRQHSVEFKEWGWNWRGRLDAWSDRGPNRYKNGFILDGKLMVSADPITVNRTIRNMGYHYQAAIYLRGMKEQGFHDLKYLVLAYDRTGNYSLTEISDRTLTGAWNDLEGYMKKFNSLVMATEFIPYVFRQSFTFWGDYLGINEMW